MTLIAIMLALLLERILSYSPAWRAHDLTGRWMDLVDRGLKRSPYSLPLYLLPPLLLITALLLWLAQLPGGELLLVPVQAVILLACLGPRDIGEEIHSYLRARRDGDGELAEELLRNLIAGPCRADTGPAGRSPVAASFVQGHERWFAVLLWFFLLGAPGAVAYRMIATVAKRLLDAPEADERLSTLAGQLHGLLAWPTARLTALLYALAGSTDHALSRWREWRGAADRIRWYQDPWPLLANVGLGSLQSDPDENMGTDDRTTDDCLAEALTLLTRAVVILLAVLALFTLGGWLD